MAIVVAHALACAFAGITAVAGSARAEVTEITVAQQYGVSFLPLMVMEKNQLIEKYATAAGLSGLKVSWVKVAGPSAMNDGLISGALHFAAQGAPSLITLWDKTNGQIKGVSAMTTSSALSRDPQSRREKHQGLQRSGQDRRAISKDLDASDHAGNGCKCGIWPGQLHETRPAHGFTIAPRCHAHAFINNTAGVNAHFSTSPFYEQEIKVPGLHIIVTTSYC